MNKKLYLLVFQSLLTVNLLAQDCLDCRNISPVFDSVVKQTVYFGHGLNIDGVDQQLYMDIYEPYGDVDTARPVMIFAFGGGFVQGSKDDWYVREVCNHFAKAGYVAVAPDYRVGIAPLEIALLQHMRIFFRPMQDMRACVQYLKADFSELGNNFKIDTSKIFVGGASAGAITALMTQYCDRPEELGEMGDLSAIEPLGGFYSSSGDYPNYNWKGVAVVNVAGALINANWIEPGDKPIIAAHGDNDNVVPYGYGPLGGNLLQGIFDLQGSYVVDSVARSKGVCSYLYTMSGHDHPNEGMGIEYIKSVVYRMAQRAHSVLNNKSFCCELNADVQGDTLHVYLNEPIAEATLTVDISGQETNNPDVHWCSVPCGLSGTEGQITFLPDTALKYMAVTVSEPGCESHDLFIITDTIPQPQSISESGALDRNIYVYPQPSAGKVSVYGLEIASLDKVKAIVYDMVGNKIANPVLSKSPSHNIEFNLPNIAAGNYVLSLVQNEKVIVRQPLIVK